ncbi:MAG TPA: hypothetical protein VFA20_30100 [Myxococcaceae bacterium]|nr:hypothetical protein [Myxococcaceae bacterium]
MPFVYPSAAILAAAVLSVPSTALACSVCGCGDPLVVAGDAMPVSGNFRFALEGEYLSVTAASDEDPAATEGLVQQTIRPVVVVSLLNQLNLVAQVPLTRKAWSLTGGTTAEEATPLGLGDIDLGARWFLWQSTNMGAGRRQSFALTAGTSLPTGPDDAVDAADVRIDDHAQLGTGAFGPYVGALYAFHQDPWNVSLNASARYHTANGHGYQYAPAALWSARGQIRLWERVAFGVGLDGRYALRDTLDGEVQTNTGGLLLAATPGLDVNIAGELWLHAAVQIPFYTALFGTQTVGPVFSASLQYSLM